MTKILSELKPVLDFMEASIHDRDDFFITSSFGYQSALLFFLLSELNQKPNCLAIRSSLTSGDIDSHRDYIMTNFDVNLTEIDRSDWLHRELKGQNFIDLDDLNRKKICRQLKRIPLLDYIESNQLKMWVSGIRRDQTEHRSRLNTIEVTDLGVIKISPFAGWDNLTVERLMDACKLRRNHNYIDFCKDNGARECGLHV
jgi:phosphoadenosine phosphosulfate reductase